MDDLIPQLLEQWRQDGVTLNSGASPSALRALESSLGVRLPEAFVTLYSTADGFVDLDMDRFLVCLWPLARINETSRNWHPRFLAFADFLLDSYAYAFDPLPGPNQPVYIPWNPQGKEDMLVADSFEDFWRKYLTEPERLDLSAD